MRLEDGEQPLRAVLEQARHHLHRRRAGHDRLHGVEAGVHAARRGERRLDLAGQDRQPAEAQQQLGGIRQVQARDRLEGLDVDVGLVEAVEQHEAVGARPVQLLGEVRQRREERRQLDGHRDGDRLLDRPQDLDRPLLDVGAGLLRVGGDEVDVQLERVGAGLLDRLRVRQPALGGGAVERRDHRDLHRRLDLADLLEVRVSGRARSRPASGSRRAPRRTRPRSPPCGARGRLARA